MQWLTNSWYGGNATDQFVGTANSFQSSKNVEIRQESKALKLQKRPVRNASAVILDWVNKFVTIQSTGDVIAFGNAGKIYRQAAGTGSFVLAYTDTSARNISDAYQYNDYLYWATPTHLHRIAVANIDAAWAGDVTENYKTFSQGTSSHHPMIEVYNDLYIGDGKYVAKLDSFLVFTGTTLSIFADEQIVGLTFNGTSISIYSQRTSSVAYSRKYLWNGLSDSYNEFVHFDGKTIHAVLNVGTVDYVLAGRLPSLYAVQGYSLQQIKQLPDFVDGDSATFNHNAMCAMEDTVLFCTVASGTTNINRGVWSFGSRDKDYPASLNNDYTTTNASASDLVSTVHYSNGKVYFAWKYGSTYGIDVTDNSLYAASGEVVSRAWDGQMGWQKKEFVSLKMSFKTLAAGEQIDVYLRRNLASSWGSAVLTAAYSDTADRSINYKELLSTLEPFNFLESKIVLTCGTSGATTPAVLDLIITSNPIEVN